MWLAMLYEVRYASFFIHFLSHPSYNIANIAFYREKVRDRPHSAIEHYEVI